MTGVGKHDDGEAAERGYKATPLNDPDVSPIGHRVAHEEVGQHQDDQIAD